MFTQVQLPAGSSAARSDEVRGKDIEARLLKIPGIKDTIALVGLNGENTAFIVSNLEPWSKRKKKEVSVDGIIKNINKRIFKLSSGNCCNFLASCNFRFGYVRGFEYQLLDKGDRSSGDFYKEAQKLWLLPVLILIL